jgi:hypothetical protein
MRSTPTAMSWWIRYRYDGPGHLGLLVAVAAVDVLDPLPASNSEETWRWWVAALEAYQREPGPEAARRVWRAATERDGR